MASSDLRLLAGVLAALRILGMSQDSVEPSALSALAYLGDETLERVRDNWQAQVRMAHTGATTRN